MRVSELWHNSLEFLHQRKIKMVSYHSDDAQTPGSKPLGIVADGFPNAWICQYMEAQLYLIDPIPQLAAVTSRPFRWTEAPKLLRLSESGKRYMDILAASGLGDGLALQVYGPNMRNAYVGLGFGGEDPGLSAEDIFELQCAAQIAHIRYCELTEHRQTTAEHLSPREMEILQWIARGKSNGVIAEILGISRHTVDTITRRIFEKLNVNDRTTAAIMGVGSGLVAHRRGRVL
ncbi:MAG: LuxR family transcriptional regulator [Roseobacter sp.]|jgi:LuxR family transcriptional regulator/LuxR family quorum-sensing system transcriptional regulator CciR|nr:LuxR family transcriptional regulator [Roseobacter sp.]